MTDHFVIRNSPIVPKETLTQSCLNLEIIVTKLLLSFLHIFILIFPF